MKKIAKKTLPAIAALLLLVLAACSCEKEQIPQIQATDQIMTRASLSGNP